METSPLLLLIPAATWLIMFVGTRLVLPRVRKMGDGVQQVLGLLSTAAVTWLVDYLDVALVGAWFTPENITLILGAWLASMGIHTVAKPAETVATVARFGPTEGYKSAA